MRSGIVIIFVDGLDRDLPDMDFFLRHRYQHIHFVLIPLALDHKELRNHFCSKSPEAGLCVRNSHTADQMKNASRQFISDSGTKRHFVSYGTDSHDLLMAFILCRLKQLEHIFWKMLSVRIHDSHICSTRETSVLSGQYAEMTTYDIFSSPLAAWKLFSQYYRNLKYHHQCPNKNTCPNTHSYRLFYFLCEISGNPLFFNFSMILYPIYPDKTPRSSPPSTSVG